MKLCRLQLAAAVAFALSAAVNSFGVAAELVAPTEPEKLHAKLKESEESGDRLLASRWQAVIRQRQWADASGKFKVYARYVNHDPGLQSVTLLILVKKGDQQTFSEKTIPVAKLGKADQALVKRIDGLRKQVEAAAAKASTHDPLATGGEGGEGATLRPEAGEGDNGAVLRPEMREGEGSPEVTATNPAGENSGYEGRPTGPNPAELAAMMQASQLWRTDFNEFARHLSATPGADGKSTVSWGELKELEGVYRTEQMLAQLQKLPKAQKPPLFQAGFAYGWSRAALGNVMWEATIQEPIVAKTEIKHDLTLPEPFSLVLVPDEQQAGDLSKVKPGDRIRFTGRFLELGGFGDKPQIKLSVRIADMQASDAVERPAAEAPPAEEPYTRGGPVLRPQDK
jgi:hypothetical protein